MTEHKANLIIDSSLTAFPAATLRRALRACLKSAK